MKQKQYLWPYTHRLNYYSHAYYKANQSNCPQINKDLMFLGKLVEDMSFGMPGNELSKQVRCKLVPIERNWIEQI
jgi:hypothetical protein